MEAATLPSRWLDGRPRLPWTRAAGPSRSKARRSRRTWRSLRPRSAAASVVVTSPTKSLVRIYVRRWSLLIIVIVSRIGGD
jgi:hypothetical protein